MDVLSKLAEFSIDALTVHAKDVHALLISALQDTSIKVRVAALQAAVAFIMSLDDGFKMQFKDMIPYIFQVLSQSYQLKNDDLMKECMLDLMDCCSIEFNFIRESIKAITDVLFQIALANDLERGLNV